MPTFRRTFFCWLCAAALFLVAASARASIIDVNIAGFGFNGQHVTISVGDTVRWRNLDATTHTVTEGLDGVLNGNEAFHHNFPGLSPVLFSVTFDAAFLAANPRPGNRYDYLCLLHAGFMRGSVTIDTGPGTPFCFCANPQCLGINGDAGAGCANAAQGFRGGRMMAAGTASATQDDMTLLVDLLPANTSVILFRAASANPTNPVAFQDGLLCLNAPFLRTRGTMSSAGGTAQFGTGLVAVTQGSRLPMHAGETWFFQAWYREAPASGNCGTGANVTNGYSVSFVP